VQTCPQALVPHSKRRVNIGFMGNSIHLEILGFSATQTGSENAKIFLRIAEMSLSYLVPLVASFVAPAAVRRPRVRALWR
jgi:hypothetical protein